MERFFIAALAVILFSVGFAGGHWLRSTTSSPLSKCDPKLVQLLTDNSINIICVMPEEKKDDAPVKK